MRTRSPRASALALLAAAMAGAACGRKEQAAPPPSQAPPPTAAPVTTAPTPTPVPTPPPVWRTLRWGMPAAEVLAALPGEAERLAQAADFSQPQPGSRLAPGRSDVGVAAYEADGARFRVLFGFESDALNRIHLAGQKPAAGTCEALERALTARHGAPAERGQTGTSLKGDEIVWRRPDQTIVLSCAGMARLGFVTVSLDYLPPGSALASN